jgi:hypothetical protein
MKIEISQDEIELAIRNYVEALGITRRVQDITFINGRNPPVTSANIELEPLNNVPILIPDKPAFRDAEKAAEAPSFVSETLPENIAVAREDIDEVKEGVAPAVISKGNSLFG